MFYCSDCDDFKNSKETGLDTGFMIVKPLLTSFEKKEKEKGALRYVLTLNTSNYIANRKTAISAPFIFRTFVFCTSCTVGKETKTQIL